MGLGHRDSLAVGGFNPAVWSGITVTRFSVGAGVLHFASQDEFARDESDDFALEYTALGISLKQNLTLGIRFFPQSRIDYRRFQMETMGEIEYKDYNIGRGGISTGTILIAGGIKEKISAGAGADFVFGSLNTLWGADFTSGSIMDVQYTLAKKVFGVRPCGGIHYRLSDKTGVGAYGAWRVKIKVQEEMDHSYSDSTSEQDLNLNYPFIAGAGIEHYLKERLILSGDVLWAGWQSKGQEVGVSGRYQPAFYAGAGIELAPLDEPLIPLYQKVAYRCGFSYQALYYQSPAGEGVNDISVSGGLGIPLKDGRSKLDIAFTLGKRGDLNRNGAEEVYYKLSFYINTGEKWFVRTKKY